jgi:hypothetical protein
MLTSLVVLTILSNVPVSTASKGHRFTVYFLE